MKHKGLLVLMILIFVLAACAPAADTRVEKPTEAMMEKPTEAMMEKPTEAAMEKPTDAMMDKSKATPEAMEDKMMDAPAWFSASLTNVRSDETFTIADFKGKVVLVETMAIWCSNCKKQQNEVKALHEALGVNKDLVSIGLDIDPNENAADLKAYTDSNGFDWVYAVAPADVINEISSLYGNQFINPPSTPMLIIDRKGEVHTLPFGIKSADELKAFLEPFLTEGM
ncbi:MAG: TlpA family protein disulfide reductase [Anaerolineae bacterium]|nr:TlpA family protein disulfide reductase [Anaerolineae bacterium]